MKKIIYDAKTGETTETEMLDEVQIEIIPSVDLKAEAIEQIEKATTIASLKSAFLKFIDAS